MLGLGGVHDAAWNSRGGDQAAVGDGGDVLRGLRREDAGGGGRVVGVGVGLAHCRYVLVVALAVPRGRSGDGHWLVSVLLVLKRFIYN